jgi:hypothetical protein
MPLVTTADVTPSGVNVSSKAEWTKASISAWVITKDKRRYECVGSGVDGSMYCPQFIHPQKYQQATITRIR